MDGDKFCVAWCQSIGLMQATGVKGSVVKRADLMQGVPRNRNFHKVQETETRFYIYIYRV